MRTRLIISIFVLEFLAFVNAYLLDLKGATVDAQRFHELATEWAAEPRLELAFDADFYVQFLGALYWLTFPSEILATQLNILALALAATFIVKLSRDLGYGRAVKLIFPFMLFPSLLTRTSTTLREPFMILSIVGAAYFLSRFARAPSLRALARVLAFLLLGALFHKAMAILFAASMLVLPLIRSDRARAARGSLARARGIGRSPGRGKAILGSAVGLLLIFGALSVAGGSRGLKPLQGTLSGDIEYVDQIVKSKSGRDARATYNAPINATTPLSLAITLPKSLAYYNFAPFPWQVRNSLDLVGLLEAIFRLAGYLAIYLVLRRSPPDERNRLLPMLTLHFLMMVIFAAGTSNYGTASRHHLVTNGFLLLYVWIYSVKRREWRTNDYPRSDRRFKEVRNDVGLREYA